MLKIICLLTIATLVLVWLLRGRNDSGSDDLVSSNRAENADSKRTSNQRDTPSENDSNEGLTPLVDSVDTFDPDKKSQAVARIEDLARSNPNQKARITAELISEITEICGPTGRSSTSMFEKAKTMSMILSDLQSIEALDALVGCSAYTSPDELRMFPHAVSVEAIANYKEKALPALKMKLQQPTITGEDETVKCNISRILYQIGGKEAEKILIEAKKNETDQDVSTCMSYCLLVFRYPKLFGPKAGR